MEEEMSIEDKLIYNNNKLVADKIRKTLLNIKNIPGISEKRWIWELIQNAKDVKNKFGKVEIKIELNNRSLIFSHNGSFFNIDNVLGILQQVSSKDSNNLKDQTGKFGTGFIGTHLLSSKVKIKGVVRYYGIYRKFELNLDRSANSSEELLKEVSKSIIEFKKNMSDEANSKYTILPIYEQKQTDFDTSFEYILEDEEAKRIAKEGLSDLINTAPVTLATQHEKIKSITIINKIDNEENKYKMIESTKKSDNINLNIITYSSKRNRNEKKIYFYSYKNEKCRLLYQVDKKESGFFVVERNKNQPILFRDFPLIGSENFNFPFFLDGFKFNPLETRNGLYLNGNSNKEAIENRLIIESAIQSSITFIDWLLTQNINKRYLLARSKIPEPPVRYDKFTIDWFINIQKIWRRDLLEKKLLADKDFDHLELRKIKLPQFKKKYNNNFFELIKKLNITEGVLPNDNDAEIWYDIMEKDPLKEVYGKTENTWGFNYLFTEEDLYNKIDSFHSIFDFQQKFNEDTASVLDWFNDLYHFLSDNNCKDCLNKYKMIPNQNGIFKKSEKINGNDISDMIPDIINPIYSELFGKEINDIIVMEGINLSYLGESIKKKNFQDILNEFSNFLKENNNEKKKEYLCKELISFSLNDRLINQMFEFQKQSDEGFRNKRRKELNNYQPRHNIWREVKDYWFDSHSKTIESKKNINNLKEILSRENQTNPLTWINNYIKFLKDNSTIVEKKKIFPDQIGNFNYIRNLRYDDSIPEILKDVYNSLKRISKNDYNIRKELLSKEINCYNGYNRFTQKEIVSEIESLFNTSSDDNIKTKIAEKIISLLPVNPSEKFIDIHNALRELIPYYIDILAVNLTPVETTITTELNYGLFIKYILVKLFTKIETMNKEEITHKINTIPKIIRFAWHYQINQNLYLLIDPKQYKIFVNQKYELNKIDKIYIREDFGNLKFTETERKLFEISNSKIINVNYEALFLNESFEEILQDYKINFRTIKFYDICNIIDTKIIEYYRCNQNNNLLDNKYEEFRLIFFSLNNILKENRFLRDKFPRFMKERGNIALKFLEDKDEEMDNFVEDVEKLIYFLTSK